MATLAEITIELAKLSRRFKALETAARTLPGFEEATRRLGVREDLALLETFTEQAVEAPEADAVIARLKVGIRAMEEAAATMKELQEAGIQIDFVDALGREVDHKISEQERVARAQATATIVSAVVPAVITVAGGIITAILARAVTSSMGKMEIQALSEGCRCSCR